MNPRNAISLCLLALLIAIGGCGSGPVTTQQPSPPPPSAQGISISPRGAIAHIPDLRLSVVGPVFFNDPDKKSLVVWSANGSDTTLATTFIDNTHLSAVIPAALLSAPVTAQVFVATNDLASSLPPTKSNSVPFLVSPVPAGTSVITSISPTSATAGSSDLTLTLTGVEFVSPNFLRSVVWSTSIGDTHLATTFVSSTQLTAVIPADLMANPGTAQILVETVGVGSSLPPTKSNAISFDVNSP